ncbi:unnamed protein product [Auanema sp. JU1783]|nr:unnamed protein product [Auanema sp. JU1783]
MSDDENYEDEENFVEEKRVKVRRFIPFNKLVEQIGSDSDKFSRRYRLNRDDNGTYFTEALTKWNDADHGADFVNFSNELPSDELDTYAQLLFHSKTIITCLFRSLKIEKSKSAQAFCEMLTALAKDLRQDFNEYIWEAVDCISFVLNEGLQDKDTVEAGFYALTSLVKVMSKSLLKTMKKSFSCFVPMLGSFRYYVRRFVSQAFAFLLRKTNNLPELTKFIVEQAEKINLPQLTLGVSMLFFQTFRGISGGFQSTTFESLRDIIFGVFKTADSVRETGLKILNEMLQLTTTYVAKKRTDLNPIQNVLFTLLEANQSVVETSELLGLFSLLIVQNSNITSLSNVERLYNLIKSLIVADHFTLDEQSINFLHLALTVCLENTKWISSCKDFFQIIIERFKETQVSDIFHLLRLCSVISVYDFSILPSISSLVETAIRTDNEEALKNTINLFATVCAARKPLLSYIPGERKPFFNVSTQKDLKAYIVSTLPNLKKYDITLASLIVQVWPWFYSELQPVEGVSHVVEYLKYLLCLKEGSQKGSQATLIVGYTLYLVEKESLQKIPLNEVEAFVRNHNALPSSTLLHLLFLKASNQKLDIEDLKRTSDLYLPVLFSPNAKQRLAILDMLSYCEEQITSDIRSEGFEGAFSILKKVENVALIDCRERLRLFRLILFGAHRNYVIPEISSTYEEIILRVAYSQFFVSFTLLWPGMHELLSSFAVGMKFEEFWRITEDILLNVFQEQSALMEKCFEAILPGVDEQNRRDYLAVRVQLIKFFAKIPQLIQRRTRVISPLFIEIYEKDYLRFNKVSDEEEEEEDDEDNEPSLEKTLSSLKFEFREISTILCAFMELYSKFNDPKSINRGKEIREIYLEILISGSEMMLPKALDALMSYKDKSLTPYRDALNGLVDMKTFKSKIYEFKISEDEGDAALSAEHRESVMPVLIRILLGCLKRKATKRLGKNRRTIIFRFLVGCRADEMQLFIQLCFRSLCETVGKLK